MAIEGKVKISSTAEPCPNTAEKDRLINDLLRSLKVAFKIATIYNPDHPAFKDAVEDLMARLNALFPFLNPLSIGFAPRSLFLDNRFWEAEKTHLDLAQLFHIRKIKTLKIRRGISISELMRFATKITLPVRELIKQGGTPAILKKEQILHVEAEVLDYSQLLRGEGEEITNIWPYLLMEAVEENDPQKLDQIAGSFDKVVGKFNTEDLIQNEELQKNFVKFFQYLKDTAQEKHRACAKDLLKTILASKKTPTEQKFEHLRLLISDLTEEDMASTLWEEVIGNDKFDVLSFSVFSKIISKERHKKISTSLRELFHSDNPVNRRPEVEKKIRILLSGTSNQLLSDIYRQTLNALLSEISFEKRIAFDHSLLQKNYHYILLNRLAREADRAEALKLLERISEEWDQISQDRDLEYLQCLLEVLYSHDHGLEAEPAFQKICQSLAELVEGLVLEGDTALALDGLIDELRTSVFDHQTYLDKIFKEKVVTSILLRAYFGFFGEFLPDFFARFKLKRVDNFLLKKIADNLRFIDTPFSLSGLIKIYPAGDRRVKMSVLKAMQSLTEFDEGFLFAVLEAKDFELKGEALVLLARHDRARHVALSKLLNLQSPYGTRNKKLIKHVRLVESRNLREAVPFLASLAQRKDFWNRKVRLEAGRILEKWSED